MEIRFLDSTAKERYLDKEGLSVSKVLEECESQYRYLKSRSKWYPALGITDKAAPKGFVSQVVEDQSIKDLSVAEIMTLVSSINGKKSSGKKKGNCNYCGSPDHWKDDCPLLKLKLKKKNQASSSSNDSVNPKNKSWRRTPTASGSPHTITKEGRTYYWCGICKRWTESHGTSDHEVGFKEGEKTQTSNSDTNATASLAVDPSVWYCSGSAPSSFNVKSFLSEVLGTCFGIIVFAHAFEVLVNVFQVLIPIASIFKRDLFFLGLDPLVSWLLYSSTKLLLGPPKEEKKSPRHVRRKSEQKFWKNYSRQRKSARNPRRYPRVGPVRRRGIYGMREHPPTVLERNVMAMLRDLRFELLRTAPTAHSTTFNDSRECVLCQRGGHRHRRRAHRRRSRVHQPSTVHNSPDQSATLYMAENEFYPSTDATRKSTLFGSLLRTALQAPRRLINAMKGNNSFPVIWDSGASHCVTFDKSDFFSDVQDPGTLRRLKGINSGLEVKGIGKIQWSMHDETGKLRQFILPALWVPDCESRLLSTSVLLREYNNEHLIQHASFMRLSGNPSVVNRPSVLVPLDNRSGLLKATMFRSQGVEEATAYLGGTISAIRSEISTYPNLKRNC